MVFCLSADDVVAAAAVANALPHTIHVLSTAVAAYPVQSMYRKISLSVNSVPSIVFQLE